MKAAIGLVVPVDLMYSAASSSAVPPISPIMIIPCKEMTKMRLKTRR